MCIFALAAYLKIRRRGFPNSWNFWLHFSSFIILFMFLNFNYKGLSPRRSTSSFWTASLEATSNFPLKKLAMKKNGLAVIAFDPMHFLGALFRRKNALIEIVQCEFPSICVLYRWSIMASVSLLENVFPIFPSAKPVLFCFNC